MIGQFKLLFLRDFFLAALNELIAEFFDSTTLDAYDVIVVVAAI